MATMEEKKDTQAAGGKSETKKSTQQADQNQADETKEKKTNPAEKAENIEPSADKNKKAKDEGLTAKGQENEKIEDQMEKEMEDDEAGDLILEDERVSVPLTMENAVFFRSPSGLISLTLKHDDDSKEEEKFERVVAVRCFPVTNPNEFISIREPDSRKKGRGKEIGMIRRMSEMSEEVQQLINDELDRRYFTPEILKITAMKEKFGYTYWDVDTTAGKVTFVLNNPFSNIRNLEDGSVFINDIDGNCFKITDPAKLDQISYRKIEIYL